MKHRAESGGWRGIRHVAVIGAAVVAGSIGAGAAHASAAAHTSREVACVQTKYVRELAHISSRDACAVESRFERWEESRAHLREFGSCPKSPLGGFIDLKLHRFDGYRLSIAHGGGLRFSRGDSSFVAVGYDGWPTGCQPD